MAELKTFLFTDIVGSVELKRRDARHAATPNAIRRSSSRFSRPTGRGSNSELAALGGRVVSTAGDGHFLVFSDTIQAARWAIGIQQSHRDEPIRTPAGEHVAVRISMHLGIPQIDPHDANNFVGKPVDYAARLNDYATGGQILVSRSVVAVLEDAGMDGVSFHLHGRRDLKGIGQVDIYELVYDAAGPRKMRPQPRESLSRQWTVLPATMGLTEFRGSSGSRSDVEPRPSAVASIAADEARQLRTAGSGWQRRHGRRLSRPAIAVRPPAGGEGHQAALRRAGHREVIRRFYQEIKAVGALEHPNIVVAIDSSTPSDAVHYLVMEYIDGIGADELVARHGPLAVADACEIARQAARGLAYIHQHGMVHRDIKPSNLMLTVVSRDSDSAAAS